MHCSRLSRSRCGARILAPGNLGAWLAVALIAACGPAYTRRPVEPVLVMVTGERIPVTAFEARTDESMRKAGVTGLAVAVINDRTLIHSTQFGWRDKDAGTRLDGSTVFAGGSLAKPVVAYLALLLVRDGVLDLDRPLYEYLPAPLPRYPGYSEVARDERYRSITARMALTHTSGLPNLREAEGGRVRVQRDPASRFSYSGEGFRLLQLVLEAIRTAPTLGGAQRDLIAGARLMWLETPTNPGLDVCDIREMAAVAKKAGTLAAVDNTTATAYLQQPLAIGADYVVASDTKGLTGHSDLILGHVAVTDPTRAAALHTWRTQHGAVPGPMETWLAHRSLATLPVRQQRQCGSAQRLAVFLASHAAVKAVYYPGLPNHAGHAIARRQMQAFGTVVSFELATAAQAADFLRGLQLVREATSFGGVHSGAERRARWGGDEIAEGFIRFSVGCEDVGDIIDDVARSLAAAV